MLYRTESTPLSIYLRPDLKGSITFVGDPHGLDLTDMLQLSIGPRANSGGFRSCMTYNPPGSYRPGALEERGVGS